MSKLCRFSFTRHLRKQRGQIVTVWNARCTCGAHMTLKQPGYSTRIAPTIEEGFRAFSALHHVTCEAVR